MLQPNKVGAGAEPFRGLPKQLRRPGRAGSDDIADNLQHQEEPQKSRRGRWARWRLCVFAALAMIFMGALWWHRKSLWKLNEVPELVDMYYNAERTRDKQLQMLAGTVKWLDQVGAQAAAQSEPDHWPCIPRVAGAPYLVGEECTNRDLTWWLADGTLLGLYRDGNLIYRDNDIDLACVAPCDCEWVRRGLRKDVKKFQTDSGHIDCFTNKREGSETVFLDSDALPAPNNRVPNEVIYPLRRMTVQNVTFWAPRQTEKYLEMVYGPGWKAPRWGYKGQHYVGTQASHFLPSFIAQMIGTKE